MKEDTESHNGQVLKANLLVLSSSKDWPSAKQEWKLHDIYILEENDEKEKCSCGHYPIKEVCILKNEINNNTAVVGNVCVKRFMDNIKYVDLSSILKVKKSNTKSVSENILELSYKKGYIIKKDYNFYKDIYRKRKLSEKQISWKQDVNDKIIKQFLK